ncbi:tyrosine-type recombinase/integrase [Candidatus Bathycorpusculum sp.]|uniref:tyrosine-type recombinase/integrase n=1 Tax=Candidatus Bathycorpusculum sp. TaxID=2994959 RepID=UPI00282476F3|nr:tyrosine-type recombinase/integrase [Candidatus Termitimicrobium sp.]MCL2685107.1 tyrosine-type recombinase/integrase [Candidatus Termitimicrobium sp.]
MTITKTNPVIHDYERVLERNRQNIKPLRNSELSLQFLDHLSALGLSVGRVAKYAAHLPVLLPLIDVDLKALTKTDAEHIVAAINSRPNKASTKSDNKLLLRKLVQYAKEGSCAKGTPLPSEVSWISLAIKEKNPRVTPETLLTSEDFAAIIRATQNKRDRAMVYVLFEAALRPGELLTMTVGSVAFKDNYCLITANGKTGIKRIPLVVACKPLLEWLEDHPFGDEPSSSLWCSLAHNCVGKQLSYMRFRDIIQRLAKRAGLKRTVWPYLYRHSSLTAMAKVFTECRLEQFAGWKYGSKMTRRYVHFSARDLEDAVLELHGIKSVSKNTGLMQVVDCPRCSNKNPFGTTRCTTCGMILDKETALRFEETQRQKEGILQEQNIELKQRIEKLESFVSSLIPTSGKL